ncbi:serine hydrolase domain-containing protein [Lapillicoccus sp.]|uniref:serine hydrolase domain-containing protein n=1 Tax=Lapillicoccus sp. TaxID=1909287 RepID=UPI0032659AF4
MRTTAQTLRSSTATTTTTRTTRTTRAIAALAAVTAATAVFAAQTAAASDMSPLRTGDPTVFRADLQAVAAAGGIGVGGAVTGKNISWTGAAGVRNIDQAVSARPGDTARIGSVTKTMVATLVMQEVQAGRWTLQSTVADVLPGLLPGHGDVTLDELLSHRSGLPDFFVPLLAGVTTGPHLLSVVDKRYRDRQLVATALTRPWLFPPGSSFSYSNTNYVILGLMLQKLNGTDLATLLKKRLFDRAGMDSATFQTTKPWSTPAHLSEYAVFERPYNVDQTNPSIFSSAGAVEATPKDLDKFYRALFNGRLLAPDLVREMAAPRSTTPLAYGLGIYAVGDPCPGPHGEQQALYGHDGATFGTLTLAFTSADGTRQAAISWTGRPLTTLDNPTAKPANNFLVDAFSANCPVAVPTPTTRTAPKSTSNLLPSLESLTLPDAQLARPAH